MSTKKVKKTLKRAAIYVRISDDKAGAGVSVGNQQRDCEAKAAELGAAIVGVYVDDDTSATSGKPRPDYERMLADIRAGSIDIVIVWHNDRLVRVLTDLEEFIKVAESQSPAIVVHPVKAGVLDLATPGGRMVARQMAAVAMYEIEMKVERQKLSNRNAALKGLPRSTQRAFGFERDGITHREREAEAIRQAVSDILRGKTINGICKRWNEEGILTTLGNEWIPVTFRQMLLRPRYAGLREYNGEIVSKAAWEPIVERSTWDALKELLSDPRRRVGPGPKPRWLLSGIARCGYVDDDGVQCMCTMRIGAVSKAAYRMEAARQVYICRSRGHVKRVADPIDDFIEKLVIARLSKPDALKLLQEEKHVDLTQLHQEAREIRGVQEGLALQAARRTITPEQMAIANASLLEQLQEIETQIAEASRGSVLEGLVGEADVEARWKSMTLERKRQIIDALMNIWIMPSGKGGFGFQPELIRVEWRKEGTPAPPREKGYRRLTATDKPKDHPPRREPHGGTGRRTPHR